MASDGLVSSPSVGDGIHSSIVGIYSDEKSLLGQVEKKKNQSETEWRWQLG